MNCDVPALWNEYQERLLAFIKKRVKDPDDANDIHQDVLVKVYNFCQHKSGVRNINSWLFQIAQNTIADYYKSRGKFAEAQGQEPPGQEDSDAVLKEAAAYVMPLIGLLPVEYAEPLILSDIQNLKQKDIAAQLGLSLSATKSRVQRARQLLKAEFSECFIIQYGRSGSIVDIYLKDNCAPIQREKRDQKKYL
jgi:RNA polymerase sigma-70 factor, ECF subfamily